MTMTDHGPLLTIEEEAADDRGVILELAGELDVTTAPELRARVDAAVRAGATAIVVDLSGVTFIDSVSLAALLAARGRLPADGRLAIVAGTPFVALILEASGLEGVLDVFDDRDDAEAFAFGAAER